MPKSLIFLSKRVAKTEEFGQMHVPEPATHSSKSIFQSSVPLMVGPILGTVSLGGIHSLVPYVAELYLKSGCFDRIPSLDLAWPSTIHRTGWVCACWIDVRCNVAICCDTQTTERVQSAHRGMNPTNPKLCDCQKSDTRAK
jgi:hypothetical protein